MRFVHTCIQSLLVMLLFASDKAMVWSQGKGQPMHQGCTLIIPKTTVKCICYDGLLV